MSPIVSTIQLRTRELGLSNVQLARLTKISLPTLNRIFSGKYDRASFATLQKLAQTLGLTLAAEPLASAEDLRESQARKKAQRLIRQLQATSALEGQALSPEQLNDMIRKTTHELLAGPPRRLWAD